MKITPRVLCPICWHQETHRAIRHGTDPIRDDSPMMNFQRPYGGARGQMVSIGDHGWWICEMCDTHLTPSSAATMIDAVLRVSDPDSDSYDVESCVFRDSAIADKGGGY